jgi:hypothetical protein
MATRLIEVDWDDESEEYDVRYRSLEGEWATIQAGPRADELATALSQAVNEVADLG